MGYPTFWKVANSLPLSGAAAEDLETLRRRVEDALESRRAVVGDTTSVGDAGCFSEASDRPLSDERRLLIRKNKRNKIQPLKGLAFRENYFSPDKYLKNR